MRKNNFKLLSVIIVFGIACLLLSTEETIDDNWDNDGLYSFPEPLSLPINFKPFETDSKELIESHEALESLKRIGDRITERRYNPETNLNVYDKKIVEDIMSLISNYPKSHATLVAKLKMIDIYWMEILALEPLGDLLNEINKDERLNNKKKLKDKLIKKIKDQMIIRGKYYDVMIAIANSITEYHEIKWEGVLSRTKIGLYKNYDNKKDTLEFLSSCLNPEYLEKLDKISSIKDPYHSFYFCEEARSEKPILGKDLLELMFYLAQDTKNTELEEKAKDILKKRYGVSIPDIESTSNNVKDKNVDQK